MTTIHSVVYIKQTGHDGGQEIKVEVQCFENV